MDREYREILGKLIRYEIKLPHEMAQKVNIYLQKKRKRSGSWVNMKEPRDEIECDVVGTISVDRQEPTTSKCHRMYIKTLFDMTVRQEGDRE